MVAFKHKNMELGDKRLLKYLKIIKVIINYICHIRIND